MVPSKTWKIWHNNSLDFPDGLSNREYCAEHWIIHAVDSAPIEYVKWIMSKGVNLHFIELDSYSPLHSCIDREYSDKYEILHLLIDNGADINIGTQVEQMGFNGWSPLHMAAARNELEAVKILLDNGADPSLKPPLTTIILLKKKLWI